MDVEELREHRAVHRADRRPARGARRPVATRCRSRPATCSSPRASTPTSGGCCSTGSLDLVRKVGREDVVVARMDVPGRWAGGFRAWDDNGIYLATGRGATPGRVLRLDAPRLTRAGQPLVPPRRAPDRRPPPHGSLDRVDRPAARRAGHARHAGGRAGPRDQQPGGRGQPHGRRARAGLHALLEALTRLARDDITAAQFSALDGLRREATESRPMRRPGTRRPRERPGRLAGPTRRGRPVGAGRDTWSPAASTTTGASAPGGLGRPVADARAGVGGGHHRVQDAARRAEGRRPPDLRSRRGRALLLPDGPGVPQRVDVRDGLESTLTMLGHKLKGGVTVESGSTPTCRRSTPTPGS